MMNLGGQTLLEEYDDSLISRHYIHFMYNECSDTWDADNAATGIEDIAGSKGIYYQGTIDTEEDDFHVIRTGYFNPYLAIEEDNPSSPPSSPPAAINVSVQSEGNGYSIRFSIPDSRHVKLELFDESGRLIRTLVNKTYSSGVHTVSWDKADNYGKQIPAGIYLIKFNTRDFQKVQKIVIY
jgi:hypothetical protein